MTLAESFKRITGQTLIVTPKHGGKSEQYEVLVDNHYLVNLFTLAESPIIPDDMKIMLILDAFYYRFKPYADTDSAEWKSKLSEKFENSIDNFPRL